MSRSFSYNIDQIIPILQMQFIPNPFERLCVRLDPSLLPADALEELQMDYDFTFEQEVVARSTEQLQSVVASEPPSANLNIIQNNGELLIPIEKLITNAPPSTQEPIHNGNGSLLNIEGFDTQSTDPFQEAELKTINDLEELQTLIFPPANSGVEIPRENNAALLSAKLDSVNVLPAAPTFDASESSEPLGPLNTFPTQRKSMQSQQHEREDQISEESPRYYMNIDELPSSIDARESNQEYTSPKPPIPAPRRLKGSVALPPNSPTPPPRVANSKNTTRTDTLVFDETAQSEDYIPHLSATPPSHTYLHKQEPTYPTEDPSPGTEVPLPADTTGNLYITNLTDSMYRDIRSQVPLSSPMEALPLYEPPQEPLSEEDKLYQPLVGMGFNLESVKVISSSFGTKDESQLIEYLLSIQNIVETNSWPLKVVETAFIFLKGETEQIKPYMETFFKYKEMGFGDESIHSALSKCGKDFEKMLEILIGNA